MTLVSNGSSTGASVDPRGGKHVTVPSVAVDVAKFDQFLDAIWPADIAKPR